MLCGYFNQIESLRSVLLYPWTSQKFAVVVVVVFFFGTANCGERGARDIPQYGMHGSGSDLYRRTILTEETPHPYNRVRPGII